MSAPRLKVVEPGPSPSTQPQAKPPRAARRSEPVGARVRRLQAQASDLAREHVAELLAQAVALEATAFEIAAGGEAYAPGIRDVARRLAEECKSRAAFVRGLLART